ncbi:MAG: hypothetical protein PHV18_09765 [Lachnospiraceae bacterium]|nr:hypothetical protein [Lachnospiraceae bacterium]
MNRIVIWLVLSCKRWLKRPAFVAILLLLPLAGVFVRKAEETKQTEIRIAVYAMDSDGGSEAARAEAGVAGAESELFSGPLEQKLVEVLTADREQSSDSLFRFYRCASEEQVKEDVAARRAECGYVVEDDLRKRLNDRDFKRCIRVYSAPSTVTAPLSSEVVLSRLLELYDPEVLRDYVQKAELFDGISLRESEKRSRLAEEAVELYETWKGNGSTFRFVYQWTDGGGDRAEESQVRLFPVRGLVAVYLLVTGMYSAAVNLADERRGLFLAVSYRYRVFCRGISLAAPVLLAACSGMAMLVLARAAISPCRELVGMIWYGAAVVIFSGVLRVVCRKEAVICGLIPFFLVGSLLFCPVFLDMGRFVPELSFVEKFFLPGYYLRWFTP